MLLDERLEKIDSLIRASLNEDTAPTKVMPSRCMLK